MTMAGLMGALRWLFSRVWTFYLLLVLLTVSLVDVPAVLSRFKARDLNDARPQMEALVEFNAGRVAADKVNWKPYQFYFSFVLKYMPHEAVSEMFLGVCDHYAGGPKGSAWDRIRRSADINPFIFWNLYDAGILAFERGDMKAALDYFQKTLILPEDKVFQAITSSVVYRQVMASSNFNVDPRENVRRAKADVHFFLAAASFYTGDHEKARNVALYTLEKMDPQDKEPLYFYAGAAEMFLGRLQPALSYLGKCVELKSKNPMVYFYAGQILKRTGDADAAQNMFRLAASLGHAKDQTFPYPDRLRLRFF